MMTRFVAFTEDKTKATVISQCMFHVAATHSTNYLRLKLPGLGTITIDEP